MDPRLVDLFYLLPNFPVDNCLIVDSATDEIQDQLKRRANNPQILNYPELEKLEPNSSPLIGSFNCSCSPTIFFQKCYQFLNPQGVCFSVVKREQLPFSLNGSYKNRLIQKMVTGCGYQDVRLYGITPSLDNPRLLVPLQNNRLTAASLGLYQPSLRKAEMLKGLSFFLGRVSLSSLWTPYILIIGSMAAFSDSRSLQNTLAPYFFSEIDCALFTGTPGALRKPTLQIMDPAGSILGYAKIAAEPKVKKLLDNEAEILTLLEQFRFRTATVPRIKACEKLNDHLQFLLLSTTKKPFSSGPLKLSDGHLEFLTELFNARRTEALIGDSFFIHDLDRRFTLIEGQVPSTWKHVLKIALDEISTIKNNTIPFGMAHRDFTPWNTYRVGGKLNVFDWEFAKKNWPPLIDLLHFIVQKGVIVEKQTPVRLVARILSPHQHEGSRILDYLDQIGVDKKWLRMLLIFYLIDIALLYLAKQSSSFSAGKNDHALLTSWQSILTKILSQ